MSGITKEDLRRVIGIYKLVQKDMQKQNKVMESIEQSTWEMCESVKRRRQQMEVMEQRIVQRMDAIGQRVEQRVSAMEQQVGAMEQRLGAMEQRAGAMEQRVGAMEQQADAMDQRVGSIEQRLVEAERKVERLSPSKRVIRQAQPSQVKAVNKNVDAPVDPPIAKQADDQPTDDAAPCLLKKHALSDDHVE